MSAFVNTSGQLPPIPPLPPPHHRSSSNSDNSNLPPIPPLPPHHRSSSNSDNSNSGGFLRKLFNKWFAIEMKNYHDKRRKL